MVNTTQNSIRSLLLGMLALLAIVSMTTPARAEVEWTFGKQLSMDTAPLDVASTADGLWMYILTPGEIAVYSAQSDTVVNRIPVDKKFDRISFAAQINTLFVSSSSAKMIRSIKLEEVFKFSLDGLAIKGPETAPVVLAVFSDYQ